MARRYWGYVWLVSWMPYVRSRFVSQKFITYIAQFNKKDMMVLADLHAVRKDDAGHRSDLQIESDR